VSADPSGSHPVSYHENGALEYRVSPDGASFAKAQTLASGAGG
jgi:hypothetical protein